MRLPRVKIEYYEEDSYALESVSFAFLLGFGIHWAWVFSVMFKGTDAFFSASFNGYPTFFLSSALTLCAILFSYAVSARKIRGLFATAHQRRRNRFFGATLVFLAMLVLLVANIASGLTVACAVLAGIASGLGSAILLMSFGVSSSLCDLPTVTITVALSTIVCALLFAAVKLLDALVFPAGSLICLAFPFGEAICLNLHSKKFIDDLNFVQATIPVKRSAIAPLICVPSALFGLALGVMRNRALSPAAASPASDTEFFMLASSAVVAIVIVIALLTQHKSNYFSFRTLCPAISLLLAGLAIPQIAETQYAPFALLASALMLEACLWISFADIAQRFRISPFVVYGFGRGTVALCAAATFFICRPESPLAEIMQNNATFLALTFVAIAFGAATLPDNAELRRTLLRGNTCPAFFRESEFAIEDKPVQEWEPSTPSQRDADRSSAELAKQKSVETVQETECAAQPSPSEQALRNQKDNARLAKKSPTPTKPAGAKSSPSPAEATISPENIDLNHPKFGPYKRKCSLIADRYLLSQRETEVMFLLAKGYNSAAVQKTLFISAGTANTHMRHIYRKLNIHSQQELMEMVAQEAIDDDPQQP